jgi:hypothetical protein
MYSFVVTRHAISRMDTVISQRSSRTCRGSVREGLLPSRTEIVAVVVHDLVDGKYASVAVYSEEELCAIVGADVMAIITDMSWSAELQGKNRKLDGSLEISRRRVQAADWFTSIGQGGLVKSYLYNRDKLLTADPASNVVELYRTRLCKYVGVMGVGEFGEVAAGIARELHEEMGEVTHDRVLEVVAGKV